MPTTGSVGFENLAMDLGKLNIAVRDYRGNRSGCRESRGEKKGKPGRSQAAINKFPKLCYIAIWVPRISEKQKQNKGGRIQWGKKKKWNHSPLQIHGRWQVLPFLEEENQEKKKTQARKESCSKQGAVMRRGPEDPDSALSKKKREKKRKSAEGQRWALKCRRHLK